MDGFGSRWTLGDLSGAVHLAADRSSVIPNGGGPRAWAATAARACETGHAARVPQGPRPRQCEARCAEANDVQANVYAAPTVRGEMGPSAGDERATRSRSTRAGRVPTSSNAGVGGPRRRWGLSGGRRPGGTGRNSAMLRSSTSGKTSGAPLGKTTPKPVSLPKRPQSHPCSTSCATP